MEISVDRDRWHSRGYKVERPGKKRYIRSSCKLRWSGRSHRLTNFWVADCALKWPIHLAGKNAEGINTILIFFLMIWLIWSFEITGHFSFTYNDNVRFILFIRPVKIIRLVGRSTVEEIVLKRADAKLKLTNTVIEGGKVRILRD